MTYAKMNDRNSRCLKALLPALLLAAAILIFGMPAFAHAGTDNDGFADGKPLPGYKYTIEVYSGIEGTYNDHTKWTDSIKAGETKTITLDIKDVDVKDDKYYVRGFRLAGHDNDETENSDDITGFTNATFTKLEEDVSYEVAYGIKGRMVAYTINYVSDDGTELLDSDTYYGMPGDKPVVSYRYVDGYLPHAYTQAKTLKTDESKNVFTFKYYRDEGETTTTTRTRTVVDPAAPGTRANPAGTAVPAGAGPANANANAGNDGGNAANIGDGDTPLAGPEQYADLDDGETPTATPDDGGSKLPLLIGIGVGLLLLIALIIWLLMRRRRAEEGAE